MPKEIEFRWGEGVLNLPLPKTWTLLGELGPRSAPSPADVGDACREAMASPVSSPPIRVRRLSGRKIVVVVDDHSRPTPTLHFIRSVLDELAAAGALREDIDILFANGVHRHSSDEEVEDKIGRDIMNDYRWRCHDPHDEEGLVDLGTTSKGTPVKLNRLLLEADFMVLLGAIEPHLLLGFGGGYKLLLPGCAAAETIGINHMQGVDPDHFNYVGRSPGKSPMRLDLEEAAAMLGKDAFLVNVTMNEKAEVSRFFCGDPIAAHRHGVEFVRSLAEVEVPEQADVVLANSYPMDVDFRQGAKILGNTLPALKPGGVLGSCVYCRHGLGEIPIPVKTLPYPILRTLVRLMDKRKLLGLVKHGKRGQPIEEIFIGHFSIQMLRRNHIALYSENLPADFGKKVGSLRNFTRIDDFLNFARRKAPKHATVWAFPLGGVTYAKYINA